MKITHLKLLLHLTINKLPSVRSYGIYLWAISQLIHTISVLDMNLIFSKLRLLPYLPGANEWNNDNKWNIDKNHCSITVQILLSINTIMSKKMVLWFFLFQLTVWLMDLVLSLCAICENHWVETSQYCTYNAALVQGKHIQAKTKWTPFSIRHFLHFLNENIWILIKTSI